MPIKIFILFLFGYMMYLGSPASVRSQEVSESPVSQGETEPVSGKVELPPSPCTLAAIDCSNTVSNQYTARATEKAEGADGKIKILKEVCEKRGMPSGCWKTLYGIMIAESGGDCKTKGDYLNGVYRSRGCFQIQTKLHNITVEQAEDIRFAAGWTLDRMKRFGYPVYRSIAIKRHNGWGQSTEIYLSRVNEIAHGL